MCVICVSCVLCMSCVMPHPLFQHATTESNLAYAAHVGASGRALIWDTLTYEFTLEYMSAILYEHTKHVDRSTLTDPKSSPGEGETQFVIAPRKSTPMELIRNNKDMEPE